MTERNVLTEWSRVLLASLAEAGVEDVILSPGSRSTPFMLAAAERPDLTCHDAIDERAAAFYALGHARRTGRPVLLVCTSGSAAAHYFPAIVEASMAHVPLIAMTADRPHSLQDCGAAQAIDQVKIYGGYVRRFFDLGDPDGAPASLRGLRRIAAQAVHHALSPTPGPVHINARAKKPLEPIAAETDGERKLAGFATSRMARPIARAIRAVPTVRAEALAPVLDRIRSARRGLIVCGPAPLTDSPARAPVFELATRAGFPVYAEGTSQLRFAPGLPSELACDALGWLLAAPTYRAGPPPDVVVHFGATPTTGGLEKMYTDMLDGRVLVHPYAWHDPEGTASELVFGHSEAVAGALAEALGAHEPSAAQSAWRERLERANRLAWREVDRELAEETELTEGAAVRGLVERLPLGSLLFVGNSLPIRELDAFCAQGQNEVRVLCQRGANGIDGLIAGAAGAARAEGGPTTLLIGDVSFLHDVSSLMLLGSVRRPFVLFAVQNRGGRIFERLPLAALPGLLPSTLEHVTTPHAHDFARAAGAFGITHVAVRTVAELDTALANAYGRDRATVVETLVSPHGAAEQDRRIRAAIESALARSGLSGSSA